MYVLIKGNPQAVNSPHPASPPPKKQQQQQQQPQQPRCFTDHFNLGVNHLTFVAGMGDFRKK